MSDLDPRFVSSHEVLKWNATTSPLIRVRTRRDAVPGGLALAMAPLYVKWSSSKAGFDPGDYYHLLRVNTANNLAGGITILGGMKVFGDSVESVEFVTVISKVAHRESPGGHAMLRFIFKEDRRPVLVDRGGDPVENDAFAEDLVLSWEAWRPPHASFDPVKGLDPHTYALTPRCYLGEVRCVADAVLDRPWHCYPLKLPDVAHAADELLYVSLALADAVGRQTVMNLLEDIVDKDKKLPEGYEDPEVHEWEELLEFYRASEVPENPIREVLQGKIRYQLMERSCVTMALSTVDWANVRIHRRGGLGDPKRVRVTPDTLPKFLDDLAAGKRKHVLLRMPAALHWLMMHQSVIPSKSHELLDEVGLLHRENGHIKEHHYDNRRHTPYGDIADHIIF